MDKNSLIGWTLMGVLMVAMMYMMQQQRINNPPEVSPASQIDTVRNIAPAINEDLPVIEPGISQGEDDSAKDSVSLEEVVRKFGAFANHINGEEERLLVENDVLAITFSNKGGFPTKVILKEYKTYDHQPLKVYSEDHGEFDISFSAYVEDGLTAGFHTKDLYFNPIITKNDDGSTSVVYRIDAGDGRYYEHEYFIPASGYLIDFNLNTKDFVFKLK